MRRSAISALALPLAASVMPVLVAGCSLTSTYGTGQSPEVAMFREVTGGLLSKDEKEPIEYQPRAPLVLPPGAEQLPPPVDSAAAASADWPIDPDERVAAVDARNSDDNPFNDVNPDEYRRLKPLAGVFPRQSNVPVNDESGKTEYYTNIVHGRQQRQAFEQALAEEKGFARTERRFLTDPPLTYREPAATAPTEFEDVKENKGNFLTRWWRRGR
jgi:hypothetical protein